MRIIRLEAENVKRLKAVEITPKEDVVIISGKNAQGKTSVLDSIWFAVAGKDTLKDTPRPIRDGEKKARVTLDLGDMIVTRTWTANDRTYLKVENKEGESFKSPQELLDTFIGKLSFDPLEFARLKSRQQRDTLLDFIDLEIDFDKLEEKQQSIYDERTLTGRELKTAEARIVDIPRDPNLPRDEISLSTYTQELEDTLKHNTSLDDSLNTIKLHQDLLSQHQETIRQLQKECAEYQQVIDKHTKIANSIERIDLTPIRQRIQEAEDLNERIRTVKQNQALKDSAQKLKTQYQNFTRQLDIIDHAKTQALRRAKMPIRDLSIIPDGIAYEGTPFSQIGSANQLKVSLSIAMALNPKLRVIRITDGSLLDEDNKKIIREMAKDNDFQIWLEMVDPTGKVGFYIYDGELAGKNGDEGAVDES